MAGVDPEAQTLHMLQTHAAGLREKRPHGNQRLFLDDIFVAELLAFFNPSIRSLRTLEDFSQTRQAQEFLSLPEFLGARCRMPPGCAIRI